MGSVGTASSGVFSSPCDSRTKYCVSRPRAEFVPSVFRSKNVRRRQIGLGQDCSGFAIAPAFLRRAPRLSSVRRGAGGAPGDDDEVTKGGSYDYCFRVLLCIVMLFQSFPQEFLVADADAGSNESKFDDTVNEIQRALGKSFGGTLWFAVLLTLLAVFGGGYVYLVVNYADFTDIPILNGPKGL